jgi:hypothetical protein
MNRKSFVAVPILVCVLLSNGFSQEDQGSGWQIVPSAVFIKHFPGEKIRVQNFYGSAEYNFAGTGLSVNVRCFNERIPNVAFTFGGGVNWFYTPEDDRNFVGLTSRSGIGENLKRQDFNTYPLTLGVQVTFPRENIQNIMFYLGGDGSLNFIDGNLDIGQQTKVGYNIVGGFAVKIFEFGIRYSSFSDLRNLGAHLGLRFNPFAI